MTLTFFLKPTSGSPPSGVPGDMSGMPRRMKKCIRKITLEELRSRKALRCREEEEVILFIVREDEKN